MQPVSYVMLKKHHREIFLCGCLYVVERFHGGARVLTLYVRKYYVFRVFFFFFFYSRVEKISSKILTVSKSCMSCWVYFPGQREGRVRGLLLVVVVVMVKKSGSFVLLRSFFFIF